MPKVSKIDNYNTKLSICWMYYIDGLSQQDIANYMGVSRLKINQLINKARKDNLVKISINAPTETIELQYKIKEKFGLHSCFVFPDFHTKDGTKDTLGEKKNKIGLVASNAFFDILRESKANLLATGWGRSVNSIINHLPANANSLNISCVSFMGSLMQDFLINPIDISFNASKKLGGKLHFLVAPFLATSKQDRDVILRQPFIKQSIKFLEKIDMLLVSLSRVDYGNLLVKKGLIDKKYIDDAISKGGIGEILGIFFDKNGDMVDCHINHHRIGGSYELLKQKRTVCPLVDDRLSFSARVAMEHGIINDLLVNKTTALKILNS